MKTTNTHKKILQQKTIVLMGIAILLALVGPVFLASAATWYVSKDGSNTNSGTDWDDAFATIQAGIDAAFSGDTVLVANGTYTGDGNKHLSFDYKMITVRSVNGPHHCIIDLENDGKGFYLQWTPTGSLIDGFTIMNGLTDSSLDVGVGIRCDGCYTTIRNCIVKHHAGVQYGAGIDIRNSAEPVIVNTIFADNQASVAASAVSMYRASAMFMNCTFYRNSGGTALIDASSTSSFTNCIFWNNIPADIRGDISGIPDITFSDVQVAADIYPGDVYPGEGNINIDPGLVDPENWNFRLSIDSNCIDLGNNTVLETVVSDLDGKPRFIDGNGDFIVRVDMGAYEYGQICECDFNSDLTTDGADAAAFIMDPKDLSLSLLAEDYGRIDCPLYEFTP